jgi:hypothetical protein
MSSPSMVQETKDRIWELLQRRPFQTFRIVLDSGDVVVVEHPENFAMWPGPETNSFHAYAEGGRCVYSHFGKITAVEFAEPVDV